MRRATAAQSLPLRQVVCARCGTAFQCGSPRSDGSCWCMEEAYRLPVPAPEAGDCVCPACLRSRAGAAKEPEA